MTGTVKVSTLAEREEPTPAGGTVLVTGVTSGIGAALARQLVARGRPVVGLGRRGERLSALRDELGTSFRAAVVDVTDREAVAEAVGDLARDTPVGALVNNAGISLGLEPFQHADPAHWDRMIDTNIRGVLNATAAVLPGMLASGGGQVVNVGSIAARYAYQGGNVYGASKAFVHLLSDNLRVDLEGTGIRVSCVAPGMTRTEFALTRFGGDQARADALYEGLRPLSADDVAAALLFVLDAPPHLNVNYLELMPAGQRFGLALGPARGRTDR
jgi:NADP-dependent 3-hydroxy acid dehydrogenase YdfG